MASRQWSRVKWSEAGQIAGLLGWPGEALPNPTASPQSGFAALVEAARLSDAVDYLGQALPRLEAVAWAARCVRDLKAPGGKPSEPQVRALKATLLWVQDPTEERRRAAGDAAEAANSRTAEALAAMAAFYSGGSISPQGCDALAPPREAAGLFAAGAVLLAASQQGDDDAALRRCLETGSLIAEKGLDAEA